MHHLCGVVVPAGTTRETAPTVVGPLMAPFCEGEGENEAGWWDYWVVGGRWTGVWSKGYNPREDHRNYNHEPCFICGGTGQRKDIGNQTREEYIAYVGGCNGCYGTGSTISWDLAPFVGDVISVDFLLSGKTFKGFNEPDWTIRFPFRLVLPNGTCPSCERWTQNGKTTDHYPGYIEGVQNEYSDVPDEEWRPLVVEALKPYLGSRIVAVDYHS